ncbi:MAG: hydrogenase maturation protease [Streptosporangiaceae bacterium]
MTGRRAVVIGIGNPYRHDDGIGPTVADRIGRLQLPGVRVVLSDGEPVSLLAAWEDADLAIVVDATRHEPPSPGRMHRLTASQLDRDGAGASSHGFGVPYALRLGQALNRQPGRLLVIAVEGADFAEGTGLSAPASAAVPAAVAAVRAELAGAGRARSGMR